MFGHNDDKKDDKKEEGLVPEPAVQDIINDQTADVAGEPPLSQASWQHPGSPMGEQPGSSSFDQPAADESAASDQPSASDATTEPIADVISPAGGFPRSSDTQAAAHLATPSLPSEDTATNDEIIEDTSSHELIDIKQKALNELSPLLNQLDQAPEEKFRTLMMMIQASDDQTMVKAAYEAAHEISDEKARAQALLDIVNEINYFTSSHPEN